MAIKIIIFDLMQQIGTSFNLKNISILLFLSLLFFSCKKTENLAAKDLKLSYFPLILKATVIYDVDSTVYNDFNNSVIKYQFQLKDSVVAKFIDLENKEAYKIERYKKTVSTGWVFQKIISKRLANNRAEEFIDNRRFVRLTFAPELNKKWNGNLYNDLIAWDYEINALDKKITLGNNTIDSTLNISQYNEVNLIREDVFSETYAKRIGLIAKEIKSYDKDIATGKIKRGFALKMQLNTDKFIP
jgi:hypothetical protein